MDFVIILKEKMMTTKSAVAFFFLFFLNGISFGTRKQGIASNYCLCEGFKQKKDL